MLYPFFETTKILYMPWTEQARQWVNTWRSIPYPWSAGIAPLEFFYRVFRDYPKPQWNLESSPEIAFTHPFCDIIKFKSTNGKSENPTMLVVAPLSGHHATLLRDTVRVLLQDFDVVVTDWKDAKNIPLFQGEFGLSDYVYLVEDILKKLLMQNPQTHIFAVCQPVVPVVGALARMGKRQEKMPQSITLMGGPIDPRKSPTTPNNLATNHPLQWFEENVIEMVPQTLLGSGRLVYPGFLQHMGFMALNPEKHAKSHWDFYEDLLTGDALNAQKHRDFYDEYNAVIDLPAKYYLETIETVFQKFLLPRGQWKVEGELIEPKYIKNTKVLVIEGGRDDIAGQGQTRAALQMLSGIPKEMKKYFLEPLSGHYALFSGRRWREVVYPVIREFSLQK